MPSEKHLIDALNEAVRLREHEAQLRVMLTEGWERQVHELQAEVERLRSLCLEAAGFLGVRSGPEVDAEADAMRERLLKAAGKEA